MTGFLKDYQKEPVLLGFGWYLQGTGCSEIARLLEIPTSNCRYMIRAIRSRVSHDLTRRGALERDEIESLYSPHKVKPSGRAVEAAWSSASRIMSLPPEKR